MTTIEFFTDFISPVSHKVEHSYAELEKIKRVPGILVKATTLYQIYKNNVSDADGSRLTMQEFFRVCGQYLYYDKYVCTHGTEFYYYVVFNRDNKIYRSIENITKKRIYCNSPEQLRDLIHVIPAVAKEN